MRKVYVVTRDESEPIAVFSSMKRAKASVEKDVKDNHPSSEAFWSKSPIGARHYYSVISDAGEIECWMVRSMYLC